MPDLRRYQLVDGPHAGEPTAERGEIERLARECRAANCLTGLASTVVETRFNVVRSLVPDIVTTARRLGDYLSPVDRRDLPTPDEVFLAFLGEAVMTVAVRSRGRPGRSPHPRSC